MFNIDNSVSSKSSVVSQLAGNKIHTVTFKGAEALELESKKDGRKFKVLKFKFENEEGVFEDTIFEPQPGDDQRKPNNFEGENPSAIEDLTAKFRHLIAALNPELDKKIEAKTKSISAKSWDDMRKIMVAAVASGVGKQVQIKLLIVGKDNKVQFPGFILGISKAGSTYMRTNFIGETVTFTTKEQEKLNAAAGAKPTDMRGSTPKPGLDDDDLDLDSL